MEKGEVGVGPVMDELKGVGSYAVRNFYSSQSTVKIIKGERREQIQSQRDSYADLEKQDYAEICWI